MFPTFVLEKSFNLNVSVFSIFRHSGNYIFATTKNCEIIKMSGGDIIATFRGHDEQINDIIINGGKLYSCSYDNTIKIWNINSAECIKTLNYHNYVARLAIIGDSLYSYNRYEVVKWIGEKYETVFTNSSRGRYKFTNGKIYSIADYSLQIIDIATNDIQTFETTKLYKDIDDIQANDSYVFLICGGIIQINQFTKRQLYYEAHGSIKYTLIFGRYLFGISGNKKIYRLDIADNSQFEKYYDTHIQKLYKYGRYLFATANSTALLQINPETLECTWRHHQQRIYDALYFAGDHLFALCESSKIYQFNINPRPHQIAKYTLPRDKSRLIFFVAIVLCHFNKNIAANIIREITLLSPINEQKDNDNTENESPPNYNNSIIFGMVFAAAVIFWLI